MKKLLLSLVFVLTALGAAAADVEVGNLKYTISTGNTNATVKGLSSAGSSVTQLTIPGSFTYNGTTYFVKTIGS